MVSRTGQQQLGHGSVSSSAAPATRQGFGCPALLLPHLRQRTTPSLQELGHSHPRSSDATSGLFLPNMHPAVHIQQSSAHSMRCTTATFFIHI